MKSRFLGILSLLVLVLVLTACDGSSGSSSSSSASGAVVAAPLTNAEVWGYNADGAAIEIGKTNSTGSIVFNASLSKVDFPSIVYSVNGSNFESGKAFSGTLKGVMQSATSAVYLTPANTLVAELVEAGMPIAQAERRVIDIVKKEIGLTKASPLANPLSDLNNSEIVAQTLMFILNTTEESADNMGSDIKKIATLMVKDGNSFRDAVKSEVASSPLNDPAVAAKTLAEVITANKEQIVVNASNALGTKADKNELEANVVIDTTSEFAVALVASSTNFASVMPAPKTDDTTFTVKTSVLSNKLITSGLDAGKNAPYSDNTVNTVVEPAYGTVAIDNDAHTAVYTVTAAQLEGVTLPVQITFVLAANADDSLQATAIFTLEGDTSLAVEHLGFDGNGLYEFTTPEEGKIVDTASKTLEATDFIAQFELLNKFAYNMSDNVDVKFTAPAGFKFSYNDGADVNTDSFLVTTISDDFKATVPAGTKLVATKEVTPGYKPVGMQVIDQKTGAVLKTASDNLIFIPDGTKQQVTRLALVDSTVNAENKRTISINAAHLDNNVYDVTNAKADVTALKLVGEFSTWEKESLTDDDTDAVSPHTSPTVSELYAKGAFYVVTTSKTAQFVVNDANTDRISIAEAAVTLDGTNKYKVFVDLKGNVAPLKYYPAASGTDTLKLMYVPTAGNGETKVSQGGLELDIKLP